MRQTAILIPTFERTGVLRLNLESLASQGLPSGLDIIVLDDRRESDEDCVALVEEFSEKIPVRYVHSGQTKTGDYWRIPGYAFNIGAKQSPDADYLILCCAEMYHFDETISQLVGALDTHSKVMVIPKGKKEDSPVVRAAIRNGEKPGLSHWESIPRELNVRYPYLMGVHAEDYYYLGGYDEDFTGIASDDDDFVLRMKGIGCTYHTVDAHVCHQLHSHKKSCTGFGAGSDVRRAHNRQLLRERRGQPVRNKDIEWGKL